MPVAPPVPTGMAEGEVQTVGYDALSRSDAHGIQRREPDGELSIGRWENVRG